MYLAGDVGGTKTILAVYEPGSGLRNPLVEERVSSRDYPSLAALVHDFLGQHGLHIDRATFGLAGPVVSGRAEITNLPWHLAEDELAEKLGIAGVRFINDLAAVAYAIPHLGDDELHTLQQGVPQPGGTVAVIAPGTGLGESFLTWDGNRYRAYASEGGHTDFAPRTALQFGLLRHLQERFGHVSYERICSGSGFPNIYAYLKTVGYADEPDWLREALAGVQDPTPVIVQAALDSEPSCDLCRAALDVFVEVLGAEAGNLALKLLATGGVFLGGGMPPHILPALSNGSFIKSFRSKGRFDDLLSLIPVRVILNPRAALLGAASHVLGAIWREEGSLD